MRKLLGLTLLLALALGLMSAAPRPVAAANPSSLADWMPATTGLYVDLRTADLLGTLNTLTGLLTKAGIPVPSNLFADADKSLTQAFGRPTSVQKDILGWMGDHAAIGAIITDPNSTTSPTGLGIFMVKDEAGADAFLQAAIAVIEKQGLKFTQKTDTLNGNPVKLYSNVLANATIARTKGYLIVGSGGSVETMISAVNAKTPGLGADANFIKATGLLKPNNGLLVYFGQRLLQYQMKVSQARLEANGPATPQAANPLLTDSYKAFDGAAFAARSDGKLLALDVVGLTNPQAAAQYAQELGLSSDVMQRGAPLTGKLLSQIPADAIAVIYDVDLAGAYKRAREVLIALSKMDKSMTGANLNLNQAEEGFQQFESGLKENLGIDINEDVLSWTGGEFAAYMTYNKTGDLATASQGAWPFDNTLLIAPSDTAKANAFIDKFNTSLKGNVGFVPTKMGDNLFSISANSPVRIGYGVTGDTFILSTGSGIAVASNVVKGADKNNLTTGQSAAWKTASGFLPKSYNQLLYLDLNPIQAYAKAAIAQEKSMRAADKKQADQLLALLGEFDSALIFTSSADPSSATATFGLILK